MSTHSVPVVRIDHIEPHPSADFLGVVRVGGHQVVVRLEDWHAGDLGVFVAPDYVVPDLPQFGFLKPPARIRPRKMRGLVSQGILVPADPGMAEGEDVMELLGITRYEPRAHPTRNPGTQLSGNTAKAPDLSVPKFDIENLLRYPDVFQPGELVVVTEKVHGANARFVFHDGRVHTGSRNRWVSSGVWAEVLQREPRIEPWLRAHPGLVLYGEVYGWVQDLRYGCRPGEIRFAAFDAYDPARGIFLDHSEYLREAAGLPVVPELGKYVFSLDGLQAAADGPSQLGPHLREGVVIRPLVERTHPEIGRVILKLVSDDYLMRAK